MGRPRALWRTLLLVMAAPLLMASCLTGDQGSALTFDGRAYLGIDGSRFAFDPARLADVGRAERITLPGADDRVYGLPGVPSHQAVVTKGPGATLTVFVVAAEGDLGPARLGVAVPGLCPYLVDPAGEACPAP